MGKQKQKIWFNCRQTSSNQFGLPSVPCQKMHTIAWKQVNSFIADAVPSWCNAPSAKQKENASAGNSLNDFFW